MIDLHSPRTKICESAVRKEGRHVGIVVLKGAPSQKCGLLGGSGRRLTIVIEGEGTAFRPGLCVSVVSVHKVEIKFEPWMSDSAGVLKYRMVDETYGAGL